MYTKESLIEVNDPVLQLQAIDVWTGVCLTFVFGALLEFALVNYASRSDAHREKLKKQRRQWEMERERERQAAFEAAAQAQTQVSDNRLDDGITAFAYMVVIQFIRYSWIFNRKIWFVDLETIASPERWVPNGSRQTLRVPSGRR